MNMQYANGVFMVNNGSSMQTRRRYQLFSATTIKHYVAYYFA